MLLSSETGQEEKRQILQQDFDIPMTQTIERTVSLMCNLSKGVEDRGIAIGMARGMEQGIARGMEQGITIGTERMMQAAIRNLADSMGITVEQAMAALKVPQSEREKYRRMLEQ